jgi:hypothetical protein
LSWGYITGPLAQLQLGLAERLICDDASARKSYEEFLRIWKDADPIFPSINKPEPSTSGSEILIVKRADCGTDESRTGVDARYDKRTIEPAEASAGRRPELRLSDRIGPVIAVVASAMSTIIAKICGVRMPRS